MQPCSTSRLVCSQTTIYPDLVSVYIPNSPILKNPTRFNTSLISFPSETTCKNKEDNVARSLRRTSAEISNILLCNKFKYFATFTFNAQKTDRTDVELLKSKMQNWLKNTQKQYGAFRYLIVAEYHKDKASMHFHALFSDLPCRLVPARSSTTRRLIKSHGKQVYNIASFTLGFTTAVPIDQSAESSSRLAVYIKKYLTKDMVALSGKKRYWVSHGLNRPIKKEDSGEWYKNLTPDWKCRTENGILLRFARGGSEVVDQLLDEYAGVWNE